MTVTTRMIRLPRAASLRAERIAPLVFYMWWKLHAVFLLIRDLINSSQEYLIGSFRLYVNVDMWRHVKAPAPLRPLATVNRSVDNVKSVGLELKICTLTSERSGTTDCRDQWAEPWAEPWAERRNVTSCLSSAPSSTGYCQRPHRLWTTWNRSLLSLRFG